MVRPDTLHIFSQSFVTKLPTFHWRALMLYHRQDLVSLNNTIAETERVKGHQGLEKETFGEEQEVIHFLSSPLRQYPLLQRVQMLHLTILSRLQLCKQEFSDQLGLKQQWLEKQAFSLFESEKALAQSFIRCHPSSGIHSLNNKDLHTYLNTLSSLTRQVGLVTENLRACENSTHQKNLVDNLITDFSNTAPLEHRRILEEDDSRRSLVKYFTQIVSALVAAEDSLNSSRPDDAYSFELQVKIAATDLANMCHGMEVEPTDPRWMALGGTSATIQPSMIDTLLQRGASTLTISKNDRVLAWALYTLHATKEGKLLAHKKDCAYLNMYAKTSLSVESEEQIVNKLIRAFRYLVAREGIREVYADVQFLNRPSLRALTQLGFAFHGYLVDGQEVDPKVWLQTPKHRWIRLVSSLAGKSLPTGILGRSATIQPVHRVFIHQAIHLYWAGQWDSEDTTQRLQNTCAKMMTTTGKDIFALVGFVSPYYYPEGVPPKNKAQTMLTTAFIKADDASLVCYVTDQERAPEPSVGSAELRVFEFTSSECSSQCPRNTHLVKSDWLTLMGSGRIPVTEIEMLRVCAMVAEKDGRTLNVVFPASVRPSPEGMLIIRHAFEIGANLLIFDDESEPRYPTTQTDDGKQSFSLQDLRRELTFDLTRVELNMLQCGLSEAVSYDGAWDEKSLIAHAVGPYSSHFRRAVGKRINAIKFSENQKLAYSTRGPK